MNAKKASHNKLMLAVDVSKLEVDAREVERKMEIVRFTLASMLPTLRRIHDFFVSHRRNSVVFRGVRSWAAYCKVRLRVTPEGVFMAERRLRLKQAAAAHARLERARAVELQKTLRWAHDHPTPPYVPPVWSNDGPVAEWAAKLKAQRQQAEQDAQDELGDDDADDDEPDDDGIFTIDVLKVADQAASVLDKIIAAGVLHGDLFADAKAAARRTRALADQARAVLELGEKPKVVSIDAGLAKD